MLRIRKKNFLKKMEEKSISDRIILKQKELQIERNPNKKQELQRDLEILNLRKQIEDLRNKIEYKQRNR